jgi:hypothetical protein
MWHAAYAMTQLAAEIEDDEVVNALDSFAEFSDPTHLARALLLQEEAGTVEEMVQNQRRENHGGLPL